MLHHFIQRSLQGKSWNTREEDTLKLQKKKFQVQKERTQNEITRDRINESANRQNKQTSLQHFITQQRTTACTRPTRQPLHYTYLVEIVKTCCSTANSALKRHTSHVSRNTYLPILPVGEEYEEEEARRHKLCQGPCCRDLFGENDSEAWLHPLCIPIEQANRVTHEQSIHYPTPTEQWSARHETKIRVRGRPSVSTPQNSTQRTTLPTACCVTSPCCHVD